MADDDFFGGGGDRTIVVPTPGMRSRRAPPAPSPGAPPPAPAGPLASVDQGDRNALTSAATPLLSLAGRLTNTVTQEQPEALFQQVAQEVRNFETAAQGAGVPYETVQDARYALCALLDDVVLNTPWGGQSGWATQTLLTLFHQEAWGGERFFQMLDQTLAQPAARLELLELFYLCLAMGLEGQYRVRPNGRMELDAIRGNVYQTLRMHRGAAAESLSPAWEGIQDRRSPLTRSVPLWVVAAVAAGLAASVYLGLLWRLNSSSDTVAAEFAALGRNIPPLDESRRVVPQRPVPAAPAAPARAAPTLAELLAEERRRGALQVAANANGETITLRALFASGSTAVSGPGRTTLAAVAEALNAVPGAILITGHTDDVPTRTARFPSNWHLSKRRAEVVAQLIGQTVEPGRLSAQARADSEPLVTNNSAENRAVNRRVEITVFPQAGRR